MASRWMAPKLAKMKRDWRNSIDPTAPLTRPGHTMTTANAKSAELRALVAAYTGVVTVCDPGRELVAQGKGKRQRNAPFALERWGGRNDGRGAGKVNGSAEYYSLWSTAGDELIQR